ncbi:DUF3099 domain-containing protein [Streptomyces sp. NPDC048663]|uniref:DUF3099 domain-containing protein n=1 Tax=Streptomyces sp. NPDC048663 TaxID=3155638 RepID=UPI0034166FC0
MYDDFRGRPARHSARADGRWNVIAKHGGVQVFRITTARQGLHEDVRGRQRRYIASMSVRTLSVILAATLWNVERYVALVALVLGVLLPCAAVVVANAGRRSDTASLPAVEPAAVSRPAISPLHDGAPTRP